MSWEDHRATQAAVRSLARSLGLDEVVEVEAHRDALLETLLGQPAPDGKTLRGAVRDHIDRWEFEVIPQIPLAADPGLEKAAPAAATARAG